MNKNFIVFFGTLLANSTFAKMDFKYSIVIEILSLLVFSLGLKAYCECCCNVCVQETESINKREDEN
jgi:hypothetical protein